MERRPPAPPAGGRISPRDRKKPVLVLDGCRSVYADWPPQTACEECGARVKSGYAGPAVGQIFRAAEGSKYLCEACARRRAGLEPGELSGHACGSKCTDDLHVELRLEEHTFQALTTEQRVVKLQEEFGPRGWTVHSVDEVPGPPMPGGPPWRIVFVATRLQGKEHHPASP